jgi:hypothetical protein
LPNEAHELHRSHYECYTRTMTEYTFNIGAACPADKAVARFVTVLGIVNNEWHRSMYLMNLTQDDPDGAGIRLQLTRSQAASLLEATKFITDSRKRFPEVGAFVDGLGDDAQENLNRLLAALDPNSPHFMDWLKDHRDVTNHFPKLHPAAYANGDEEIANALAAAASHTGTITSRETQAKERFGFADEVAVQLLPDIVENPDEIKKLAAARIALGAFARAAIAAYIQNLPAGVVSTRD